MFEIELSLYIEHKPACFCVFFKYILRLSPCDRAFLEMFMSSWIQEISAYFMKTEYLITVVTCPSSEPD